MKAARLTTAFAVVLGAVLPMPVVTDLVPATWAAEKGDPPAGDDLRRRAEDLAKSASDQFGKIVGGKEEQGRTPRTIDVSERSGPSIGLVEQVHGWTSRSAAEYQTLMRGLSQPSMLNPVADAATRLAAGRSLKDKSETLRSNQPRAQSLMESAVGWIHRAGREYQTVVRGLSVPGSDGMLIAGKTPAVVAADKTPADVKPSEQAGDRQIAEAKQAESASQAEARRAADAQEAEARRAEQSRLAVEEKRAADARKTAEARQTDEARRVVEAKQAADAREAAEARRVAEARAADDARKAEELRVAAAAKQAEDARRAAEAQKAADARRAEEMRVAAVAKQAEDARRVAEAQIADARRAEETRIAAAKQAEDVRRAEDARRVAEAQTREASQATAAPSRKRAGDHRKVSQKRAGRKERTARKGGPSRKVAVASSRKRAKAGSSAGGGKGQRWKKTHPELVCRMAGARTSVPGWYIARREDTLWKIAARHYGAGRRFPVIYRANARRIADPNRLVRCQRLYLPKFRRRG